MAYPYALTGYRETLAHAFANTHIELWYADERLVSDHVLRKIEGMLADCDLALFDLTGANPNVCLELGLAIAANHPYVVALHKDSVSQLNADIHGWDQLRYGSVEELGGILKRYIENGRVPARQPKPSALLVEEPNVSPLGEKGWPVVSLQPQQINPDSIFGLHILPKRYARTRYTLDTSDDEALRTVERRSRGLNGVLHGPLELKSGHVDGVVFSSGVTSRRPGESIIPSEQIVVDSDGEIVIRFSQNDERPIFQFLALLATGYVFARAAFSQFGIALVARCFIVIRLDARREKDRPTLPSQFEDSFEIDFGNSFETEFTDVAMRLLRASAANAPRNEIADMLSRFKKDNLGDELI